MGIITVLALSLAIFGTAALVDGICSLFRRMKEALEWRKIKKIYY
mgnify:CR=1 FL=1